jgi:hypothetical protein
MVVKGPLAMVRGESENRDGTNVNRRIGIECVAYDMRAIDDSRPPRMLCFTFSVTETNPITMVKHAKNKKRRAGRVGKVKLKVEAL